MRLRRLSRSPVVFWALVVLLAVVTATVVGGLVRRARDEAARYGSLRTVAVARRAVDPGTVLGPADVSEERVPAAFLPDGWVPSASEVVGRTAVVPLFGGAPVLRGQVAPWGLRGVAALLPPGARAVAVPTGDVTPALRTGDLVDVLATFDAAVGAGEEPTVEVAVAALVVDVAEESATVAVAPDEARRVAFALSSGAVSLTLRSGP
ncbi:MAG TPA: Flp pilus assembly protein CpaB [Acidimicrobiales bacterium]|nr:Flp pilus assembly protein CpaB [Acidimicrobiales bacterium]